MSLEPSDEEQKALAGWIKWVNRTPKIAASVLGFLIVAYAIAFWKNGWSKNPDAWGQLGDYIGGLLNPLVAGFALMALVVSIRLQKAELAETRKELENSRLAMEEQAKTAEQQRREQRFFDLLNLYQEMLKSFVINGSSGKAALNNWDKLSAQTLDCVSFLVYGWSQFPSLKNGAPIRSKEEIEYWKNNGKGNKASFSENRIKTTWSSFSPILDHYFRTIFSILGELEKLLGSDHWRYGKLFRAQLSRDELTLLAFNLLFDEEGKKMRPRVAKYGLLKHLAQSKLRDHAITELDPKSFGSGWVKAQAVTTPREEIPC
jgi:hypothetical protein